MNELQIFNNPEFGEVRTFEIDGEPWFVLRDVCNALDISKTANIAGRLDDDDVRLTGVLDNRGIEQQAYIISESGLYNAILRSDKPQAKTFQRWITKEVIPTIRKTGSYGVPQLSTNELVLKIAQANVEYDRQLKAHDERLEAQDAHLALLEQTVQESHAKLDTAISIFAKPGNNWKDSMELAIREMADDSGWGLIKIKGKLYQELEVIANVDIQSRLTRKRNRMKKQGATRREYMAVNKLDIISYDDKLRPIFEGIIRKYQAECATK